MEDKKEAREVGPEVKSKVKRVVTRDGKYITETSFHSVGNTEYRVIRNYILPPDWLILVSIMVLLIFLVYYVGSAAGYFG